MTIAEQCRRQPDPLTWARAQAGYKSHPHDRDVLVFHFEDGSCLEFDITYTAGKTDRSYEE